MTGVLQDRRFWMTLGLAVLLLYPVVASGAYLLHIGVVALIFAILASTWDLTLGYGRVFNFFHIAFFALGAYTSGVLSVHAGVDPWFGLVAGAAVAGISGALVYLPVYRLRGIYVALITFAASQLCLHVVVSQSDITGGFNGLVGLPAIPLGPLEFLGANAGEYYLALALLVASTAFLRWIVNSDFGLSLRAAGVSERYAASRGVPVSRQRVLSFVASAVFAGAAGAFYAHYLGVVSPELFSFTFASLVLSMVIVGGTATTFGPIVAAVVLSYVTEQLNSLGPWRVILVSVVMVITLLYLPGGVWRLPDRLRETRRRRSASPLEPLTDGTEAT